MSYLNVYQDKETQKWVVEMVPDMLNWYEPQKLLPGQSSYAGYDGWVTERSEPLNEGWASRPWFKTHTLAVYMAQEWIKRERKDIYAICIQEVREGRAYRAYHAAKAKNA